VVKGQTVAICCLVSGSQCFGGMYLHLQGRSENEVSTHFSIILATTYKTADNTEDHYVK
jgi:hypothetical protein